MTSYRFVDLGPTVVDVTNRQFRALLGLRGEALGFNWETAALYSQATVRDVQDGISATLLQQNLALSTPDRSEEHTSELQSLMRISYAVFCLQKKTQK